MKAGQKKEGSKLSGQFAEDLQKLVEGYFRSGALQGAIADNLEGMANRVRLGEFHKEGEL